MDGPRVPNPTHQEWLDTQPFVCKHEKICCKQWTSSQPEAVSRLGVGLEDGYAPIEESVKMFQQEPYLNAIRMARLGLGQTANTQQASPFACMQ